MIDFENLKPEEGINSARDILGKLTGFATAAPKTDAAASVTSEAVTDRKGNVFDSEIYKVDPATGKPLKGSVGQFLKKKEAKKSAFKKIVDAVNPLHKEIPEIPEEPIIMEEKTEFVPQSDHIFNVEREKEAAENIEEAEQHAERVTGCKENAENMADTYFLAASMFLGPDVLKQHGEFFPRVTDTFFQYEMKTGRTVAMPPEILLFGGLARLTVSMASKEPDCKARLDGGVKVVRENLGGYIKAFLPGGKKQEKSNVEESEESK